MKVMKFTQCAAVVAMMFAAQAYAAPVDSDPTAVNFSGNVTTSDCAITGATASQVITLDDMTINDVTTLPVGASAGSQVTPGNIVETTLDIVGCVGTQNVYLTYSGVAGATTGSFLPTSGVGKGVDFAISAPSVNQNGVVGTFSLVGPGVKKLAINTQDTFDLQPSLIYQIPLHVGVVRNTDTIQSGNVSMVTDITLTRT